MDNTGPKPRLHVFGFMDETGLLNTSPTDRVFGLGLLVCQNPRELHRAIITLKNKRRYHREFKFTDVTKQNLRVYLELIDIFFSCTNNRFHSLVVDKNNFKVKKGQKPHIAYNMLAAKLISSAVDYKKGKSSEYITILADDVSTSKDDRFEKTIREAIKKKKRRNALFGICRLESHAVSEIQIVDVLLGLVAYSYKIKHGTIRGSGAKLRLLKHLQRKLDISELSNNQSIKLRRGEVFEVTEN
jgi:hypothetical protein